MRVENVRLADRNLRETNISDAVAIATATSSSAEIAGIVTQ